MNFYDEIRRALMPVVRELKLPVKPFERGLSDLLDEYPRYRVVTCSGNDEDFPDHNLCDEHTRYHLTAHPDHRPIDQWICTCEMCEGDTYRIFDFEDFARYATAWGFGIRKTPDEMHDWIDENCGLTHEELRYLFGE